MTTKNLAKSLHTVSAITNVALAIFPNVFLPGKGDIIGAKEQASIAVHEAMRALDLLAKTDSYNLRGQAIASYLKKAPRAALVIGSANTAAHR